MSSSSLPTRARWRMMTPWRRRWQGCQASLLHGWLPWKGKATNLGLRQHGEENGRQLCGREWTVVWYRLYKRVGESRGAWNPGPQRALPVWRPWEALPLANYCSSTSDPRTPLNVPAAWQQRKRQPRTLLILNSARVARSVCMTLE